MRVVLCFVIGAVCVSVSLFLFNCVQKVRNRKLMTSFCGIIRVRRGNGCGRCEEWMKREERVFVSTDKVRGMNNMLAVCASWGYR